MNNKNSKACMFPGCEKTNYGGGRGLCPTHLVGCSYQVKKEKETWESLEERGICRKKMTQKEKNINQMHPHKSYNGRARGVPGF